ncbi:MAG: succinate dehydrogenase assembly factor 2 [Alphaproteobacteria bacterium]|nr:succinate dehydrogenase assembly factor 2 [Alphaproteobacteria bacterium]
MSGRFADEEDAPGGEAARRRRARYRAWHRGIKEMDLVLGPFADRHVDTFSRQGLAEFERLLDCADQDIYDWLTGRKAAPEGQADELLDAVRRSAFGDAGAP